VCIGSNFTPETEVVVLIEVASRVRRGSHRLETDCPGKDRGVVSIHAATFPCRAVLATEDPLPVCRVDGALESGDSGSGINSRLDVTSRIARGEDDFTVIGPRNNQQVIRHLATKCQTDPLVYHGGDDFTNEFLGFRAGRGVGREDEPVRDVVCGLKNALESDAAVCVCSALRECCRSECRHC